jgi:hypothetical protein
MQEIVHGTADDIKKCANGETKLSVPLTPLTGVAQPVILTQRKSSSVRGWGIYLPFEFLKIVVVKVLKGPIWEGKLVAFVGTFTKRRSEFEFALSIHTALGVDAANKTLSAVDQTTQEMNAKMDMMMKMFTQLASPEHKQMARCVRVVNTLQLLMVSHRMIEQRGGDACVEDDDALRELSDFEEKSGGTREIASKGPKLDLDDLKESLHTDPDAAMEKNMAKFNRKLEVQTRQIIDEVNRAIQREGDRVISAVNAGPHDRIIDPVRLGLHDGTSILICLSSRTSTWYGRKW